MQKPVRIVVGKVRRGRRGEYVGRPTPLGNPFRLEEESEREKVVGLYRKWLEGRLAEREPAVIGELERLARLAERQGELRLTCWCAPRLCHAEVVAEALRERLEAGGRTVLVEVEGR